MYFLIKLLFYAKGITFNSTEIKKNAFDIFKNQLFVV